MSWKIESFKLTGKRHRENRILCQDQVAGKTQEGKYAISLVDGIGKTDENAKFGKIMTVWINQFLIENYEKIRETDEKTIAYNLMLNVESMLEERCKQIQIDKKELSSTLLGAVIDTETDTFCLIHLGDGAIAGRLENNRVHILSEPLKGKSPNETVLSTMENALGYVKIKKGELDGIKEIMLVSDGIYNGHRDIDNLRKCFFEKEAHDILREAIDDQSFIKLSNIIDLNSKEKADTYETRLYKEK